MHVAYCERLGKIFSWWVFMVLRQLRGQKYLQKIIENIISCKCHRCIICWHLIDFTYIIHCTTFFVGSLSFLDQVRLQSVCFLLSTKVGFGMSNLQASLRRTSSCPFRDCCSRWARDPNMKTNPTWSHPSAKRQCQTYDLKKDVSCLMSPF